MKQILFLIAFSLTLAAAGQSKVVRNYPVLGNLNLLASEGVGADENSFAKQQQVVLQFYVLNPNAGTAVKAGTCELHVDLGQNLQITKEAALPLTDYVTWSVLRNKNGNPELTGKLHKDLPADFMATLSLSLSCGERGSSSVKAYWALPLERSKTPGVQSINYSVSQKQ